MPRLLALALSTLVLGFCASASAQTTMSTPGTTLPVESGGAAVADPATAPTGAVPTSGGTAVPGEQSGVSSASDLGAAVPASGGEATATDSGGAPASTAAQEPEPQPEGPGEEQPDEPDAEAEPPAEGGGELVQGPRYEAPATGGGGLPQTGLELLKLGLLGLVLLLAGARLRAIVKRRGRPRPARAGLARPEAGATASRAAPRRNPPPRRGGYERQHALVGERSLGERDEWSFPDRDAPAPTGLLPSTAMARRRARLREQHR